MRALPSEEGKEIFPTATELNIPQTATTLDDTARMLAGLKATGIGGHPMRLSAEWQQHQTEMDKLWSDFKWRHQSPIEQWSNAEIDDLHNATGLFYPFSGPDVIFAHHFFPHADTYVLCGLESCEPLPPMVGLSSNEIADGLNGLRNSLNTAMQFSFFVTKDMRNDLVSTRFRGVLPIMLVFLARTGHTIDSVDLVKLDISGTPQIVSGSGAQGIMIRSRGRWGQPKRVFYFRQDLSDSALSAGHPLLRFVSSLSQPPAFLKSASYLMHGQNFGTIREYLLENCRAIVQDPSGIPYRELVKAGHNLRLYGNYQGTINIFREHQQADLIEAYVRKEHQAQPISFGIGYIFDPDTTCLMVARK
jgi:hypothetical protein